MTNHIKETMEMLLKSNQIKDYIIDEGPYACYYIVQKHDEGWVPLQTWLDRQEEMVR